MKWIDSHCHLHEPWFKSAELEKLARKLSDFEAVINCASDLRSYDQVVESGRGEKIYYTLGIQPTIAHEVLNQDFPEFFGGYIRDHKFRGIGEVGLDYYWVKDEKSREIQREVFTRIIEAANELNQPLIIHSRKAESDSLDLLERHANVPVLLHSFDGNLVETKRAVELGYLISIPSNVVIRKNRRKTVKRAGLESIMLETDAPFCAPSPDIERNSPESIRTSGEYIAKLLELDVKVVSEVTTENAVRFYKL